MTKQDRSGWHLMVDALVGDPELIESADIIRDTLLRLVRLLDMRILDGPRITAVDLDSTLMESDSDEGGITGYCLITTSHISIHTWPLRQRLCLDIFSCKKFDKDAALAEIRGSLGVRDDSVTWTERCWPSPVHS